MFFKCY
ncbi:hypothetical protein YPPY53_4483, partial [Yersinia pestis PY-53]